MLYQAYGCKERTKNTELQIKQEDKRKNLTIILTNKKQKAQTIVLVNKRMSVKLRRKYPFQYPLIGLLGRVFTNDPGVRGSIPGRVIPKT